jgi:hypothetical protein
MLSVSILGAHMNLLVRSSIATVAITAFLSTATSAISAAKAYKTEHGLVIVTGLTPTKRYQIRTLTVDGKAGSRLDKSADRCGEVIVERATNYKTLAVGSVTVDPAKIPTRTYKRCKSR